MKVSKTPSWPLMSHPQSPTFSAQTPPKRDLWNWLPRPPRNVVTQIAKGVQ